MRRAKNISIRAIMALVLAGCASQPAPGPRGGGECPIEREHLSHEEHVFYSDWGKQRWLRLYDCDAMCEVHVCTFTDRIPHRNLTIVAICRPFVSCRALPANERAPDPRDLRDRELPP